MAKHLNHRQRWQRRAWTSRTLLTAAATPKETATASAIATPTAPAPTPTTATTATATTCSGHHAFKEPTTTFTETMVLKEEPSGRPAATGFSLSVICSQASRAAMPYRSVDIEAAVGEELETLSVAVSEMWTLFPRKRKRRRQDGRRRTHKADEFCSVSRSVQFDKFTYERGDGSWSRSEHWREEGHP